jgi:hypothetical protein
MNAGGSFIGTHLVFWPRLPFDLFDIFGPGLDGNVEDVVKALCPFARGRRDDDQPLLLKEEEYRRKATTRSSVSLHSSNIQVLLT